MGQHYRPIPELSRTALRAPRDSPIRRGRNRSEIPAMRHPAQQTRRPQTRTPIAGTTGPGSAHIDPANRRMSHRAIAPPGAHTGKQKAPPKWQGFKGLDRAVCRCYSNETRA